MGKERLKDRLKNARKKLKVEKENPQTSNIGQAFKLSTELVAAVLVGTIIGFISVSYTHLTLPTIYSV